MQDASNNTVHQIPEDEVYFGLIDDEAEIQCKKEWRMIGSFPWFIDYDDTGFFMVNKPSIWIIAREEYLRIPGLMGVPILPRQVIPASSLSVADYIADVLCRMTPGFRNLGVVTVEDLMSVNEQDEQDSSCNDLS